MTACMYANRDTQISLHNVTNLVLMPPRKTSNGNPLRTLMVHTEDGDVEIDLFAAKDGNLAIAEPIYD